MNKAEMLFIKLAKQLPRIGKGAMGRMRKPAFGAGTIKRDYPINPDVVIPVDTYMRLAQQDPTRAFRDLADLLPKK